MGIDIFNIQHFSGNDGPGIRTTVFLKGCYMHCAWCHNPESISATPELFYDKEQCIDCFRCVYACDMQCHQNINGKHIFSRNACILCGKCANVCPNAIKLCGRKIDNDDLVKEIVQDELFYKKSGGGVTFSGGEPLIQSDELIKIIEILKEKNVNVAMETSGYTSRETILKFVGLVDLFLYDYKLTDDALHRKYTGVSNRQIISNLYVLDNAGAKIRLRCPIIPGINDTDSHLQGIISVANRLNNLCGIDIEPYHKIGIKKYQSLQKTYTLQEVEEPDALEINKIIKHLSDCCKVPVRRA